MSPTLVSPCSAFCTCSGSAVDYRYISENAQVSSIVLALLGVSLEMSPSRTCRMLDAANLCHCVVPTHLVGGKPPRGQAKGQSSGQSSN
jgi:hypothetical protein